MPNHRIDPIFGEMLWKNGQWSSTFRWEDKKIPITIDPTIRNWEQIHTVWKLLHPKLKAFQESVNETVHYDYSIEWGNQFQITEEQLLEYMDLEAIHFTTQGCQLIYNNDKLLKEEWISQLTSEKPGQTKIVLKLDWDAEFIDFDYLDVE